MRAEEGEEPEPEPDRREVRTMASKETSAAGYVNVSREITGEPEHEFSRKCVLTFNGILQRSEEEESRC